MFPRVLVESRPVLSLLAHRPAGFLSLSGFEDEGPTSVATLADWPFAGSNSSTYEFMPNTMYSMIIYMSYIQVLRVGPPAGPLAVP